MKDKLFEAGLKVRKQVLSAEYVDRQFRNADDFTLPMQMLATKSAWGMVWARPGLPRACAALGRCGQCLACRSMWTARGRAPRTRQRRRWPTRRGEQPRCAPPAPDLPTSTWDKRSACPQALGQREARCPHRPAQHDDPRFFSW